MTVGDRLAGEGAPPAQQTPVNHSRLWAGGHTGQHNKESLMTSRGVTGAVDAMARWLPVSVSQQ